MPAPTTKPSAPAPRPDPPTDELDPNTTAAEPDRKTLKAVADDPAIDKNRDFIASHYGTVQLPFPLQLQSVPLPHGRRAVLLTGTGPALDKPLVLVLDASHDLVWSKPKPLAGTRERWKELTLSRGPHGEVFLFWYDEPTQVFAARSWTYEGNIFADFQVFTSEGCDGASALFWPGHGWVAALLHEGTLHAQLLGEAGTLAWPGQGVTTQLPGAPKARPKIAIADGKTIEITVGPRKVKLTPEGAPAK